MEYELRPWTVVNVNGINAIFIELINKQPKELDLEPAISFWFFIEVPTHCQWAMELLLLTQPGRDIAHRDGELLIIFAIVYIKWMNRTQSRVNKCMQFIV